MHLSRLPETYAVARAATATLVPEGMLSGPGFRTISRTEDELSVVAPLEAFEGKAGIFQKIDSNWACFKLHGPFAFDELGIVAGLAKPLLDAAIGIFVVSTFDTDYVLVKQDDADTAAEAWRQDGYTVGHREN